MFRNPGFRAAVLLVSAVTSSVLFVWKKHANPIDTREQARLPGSLEETERVAAASQANAARVSKATSQILTVWIYERTIAIRSFRGREKDREFFKFRGNCT